MHYNSILVCEDNIVYQVFKSTKKGEIFTLAVRRTIPIFKLAEALIFDDKADLSGLPCTAFWHIFLEEYDMMNIE
jgi:hypothetical protein